MLVRAPRCAVQQAHPILRSQRHSATPILRRTFFGSTNQTVSASQVLPYSRQDLYAVIADISSYPKFLPFCNTAEILAWSKPDQSQRRWPARALLGVGWGAIEEQYVSRVYCIPNETVEALAGYAKTDLPPDQLQALYGSISGGGATKDGSPAGEGGIFRSLRSTWSLHDRDKNPASPATRVDLKIDFDFQNPIHAAMAGAAIPKIADSVIQAFRARAKAVIEQHAQSS